MLNILAAVILKYFIYLILFTVFYNAFIVVTKFRCVKFAFGENMFFLPLIPFIGTTYIALLSKKRANMLQIMAFVDKYFGGPPFNFWFGSKYHYVTNNAEEANIILNHPKCLSKAGFYDNVQDLLKNSILTLPAKTWKSRRHYLRTAFKMNMLKYSYPIFYEQSVLLFEDIKKLNPEDDLYKLFNKYAFINFCLSSFGISNTSQIHDQVIGFATGLDKWQDEFVKLFANPVIPPSIWKRTPFGAKLRELEVELETILKYLLQVYQEQDKKGLVYFENATDTSLIELLLDEAFEKDTDSALIEEFAFIAGAATDTAGHTLALCFTILGIYPEVQAKAYEEVQSVIGDRNIEFADLQKLKYIDAVVCETLRLMPTVPAFGRYCDEDIQIGKKCIPKGVSVLVSAFHVQRSPKYWKDPLKFDPSRFFPENVSKIVPGSYLPFSIGARNCIGQSMAMTIIKLTVANVVRSFMMTSSHKSHMDLKFESCITIKTEHHLHCNFIPRIK